MSLAPNAGIPAGLRQRATDALASAADMKSDDWADLVGGLLKFFGEEAEEPEHAEDSDTIKIDAEHDGPWVSCMSKDGGTMYRNSNLPKEVEIKGKTVDLDEELKAHEVPEWKRLQQIVKAFVETHGREPDDQERANIYQEAHDAAGIPGERAYCKEHDIDYDALQAWFRGEETKLEKGPFRNEPTDADVKPIPHKHELATTIDQIGGGALRALESGIPQKGTGVNTDSALRLALDRASVRSFDEDGRMRVSVANISKANICPYRGDEIPGWEELGLEPDRIYKLFRDPEELRKSVPTWNGIQILKAHKPVDVNDHQKHDIVGTTGTNTEFSDPYLRNSLIFWTKEGIDLVETDEQRELSCGYHYIPDMTPGVYNGESYDGVMRNIRGNHVAIVEEGRAGPDVIVGDTLEQLQWAAIEDALTTAWAA